MKNKLSKATIINCVSIIAILFVAFFASHSLVMMGALVTSSFAYPLLNAPVILSGLTLFILLMFYLKEAYIKFVSFRERCIVLGITSFLSLVSLVLYGLNIVTFFNNGAIIDIMMMVFSLAMLVFSILSIVFAKKGKYKEEFFKETRYYCDLKTRHYVFFVIFAILANYSLYAIFLQLRTIRNITIHPLMYLLVLLALIMIAFSFIVILIDKKKNVPVLKIVVAILNFFTLLLLVVSEIIVGGIMIKVAKPICFIDFAISIPLLFYFFFIDLIAKTTYLVVTSLKK